MLGYRMRIKDQEEIRDKSNLAASKKPSLNAILEEIPKFKNYGTTNTQRQRNSFKQNIKQFSLLVLIIKKSTRLKSDKKPIPPKSRAKELQMPDQEFRRTYNPLQSRKSQSQYMPSLSPQRFDPIP